MPSNERTPRAGLRAILGWMLLALLSPGAAFAQTVTIVNADGATLLNEIEPGNGVFFSINAGGAVGGGVATITVRTVRAGSATCLVDRGIEDVELVQLREIVTDSDTATGPPTGNTGLYRGFISTTSGPIVPNDGTLQVRGGDRIETLNPAAVLQADTAAVATNATVRILEITEDYDPNATAPAVPLPDEAGEIKLVTAGKSVLIVVEDQDENCDPALLEQVTVNITTTAGADTEAAFVLNETGVDTGIFIAVVPTRHSDEGQQNNDNLVQVRAGVNEITVVYTDVARTQNDGLVFGKVADVRGGVDGTITINGGNPVTLGGNAQGNDLLTIQVLDNELSGFIPGRDFQQGPGNDTVAVTIRSTDAAGVLIDEETFEIPENPVISGQFDLAVSVQPNTIGLTNDQVVQVVTGGILGATYIDPLRLNGRTQVQIVAATVTVQNVQVVAEPVNGDALGTLTAIVIGGPANTTHNVTTTTLTVTDLDADRTPGPANDTITVSITSEDAAGNVFDVDVLEVPEDDLTPGLFLRTLDVIRARSENQGARLRIHEGASDELIEVVPQGTVRLFYEDPFDNVGNLAEPLELANTIVRATQLIATIAISPAPVFLGFDFTATENTTYTTLTVVDSDQNLNEGPANDSVLVTVRSFEDVATIPAGLLDEEVVELREDPQIPGTFLATLDVRRLRVRNDPLPYENRNDGVIEAVSNAGNGRIQASYIDPFRDQDDLIDQPVTVTEAVLANPIVAAGATLNFVDLTTAGLGPIVLGHVADDIAGPSPGPLGQQPGLNDQVAGFNSVTVLVTDPDEDLHVGPGNDSVFVTLTSSFQGNLQQLDREVIEVPEDPVIAGTFRRTIPARARPAEHNNGILEVRITQNVILGYVDKASSSGLNNGVDNLVEANLAALTGQGVRGGDDACANPATSIVMPDFITPDPRGLFTTVIVEDLDENRNNGPGNDTVAVTLSAFSQACAANPNNLPSGTGLLVDRETILIPEHPDIPGRFEIKVPTSFGVGLQGRAPGSAADLTALTDDGVLQIVIGGSAESLYIDRIREGTEDIDIRCYRCADIPVANVPPCNIRIVTDNGGPVSGDVTHLTPGHEVYVEVTSQNSNVSPGIDTLPITLTSSFGAGGGDLEDLLLYETAPGSGVFTGTMQTIFGDPILANGNLEVRGTSVITASFVDRLGAVCIANTDTVVVEIDGQIRFLSNGGRHEVQGLDRFSLPNLLAELRVSNDVLGHRQSQRAGDPVFIVLQDDDLNLDPQARDTVSVTIQSFRNDGVTPHDQIVVDLVEVDNLPNLGNPFNTGVFIIDPAIFPSGRRTRLVAPGTTAVIDQILEVEAGGFLRTAYNDGTLPRPANQLVPPIPEPRVDEMNIQAAQNAVVSLSAQDTGNVNFVRVGQNIAIEVVDDSPLVAGSQTLLTGHDPNAIDTIRVSVTSGVVDPNGVQDRETFVLFETGLDTRVFRGFAPTRFATVAIIGNGILEMADTNVAISTVVVEYVDPQPLEPDPINSNIRIVTDTIRTLTAADGAVTIVRQVDITNDDEFLLGDQLLVTVTDPDLAIAPEPASIQVTLTAPSGDVETLRMDRIAAGQYQGFIKSMYMEVFLRENNLLEITGGPVDNVTRGEPVTATYLDNLTADGRTDFVRTFVIRGFYTGTLHIVDRLLEETQFLRAAAGGSNQPQSDRFFIKLVDPDLDVPPARNTDYVTPTIGGPGGQIRVEVRNNLTGALVDQETISNATLLTELRRYDQEPRNNQGETIKGIFSQVNGTQIRFLAAGTAAGVGNFENSLIDVVGNDVITVTYVDINTNGGHPELNRTFTVTAEVRTDGSILIVDSATSGIELDLIVPMETASPGTIFIRVLDKDLDRDNLAPPAALADPLAPVPDPLRPGSNLAVLMVTDAGDRETFEFNNAGAAARMTEANGPGEFRNFTNNQPGMPVVFGQPIPGNGVLELVQGDLITVSYTDERNVIPGFPTRRTDTANSTRRTSARIDILNPRTGRFQEPNRLEQFIIGEPFRVRVTDFDLDFTAIPDTLQITITTDNPVKPDLEVITLTEADRITLPISGGVFEGELPSDWHKLGNTAQLNGVLTLAGGDLITVTITDIDAASKVRVVQEVIPTAETYRANVRFEAAASSTNVAELPNGSVISIPSGTLKTNEDVVFILKYRTAYIDEFDNRIPPPLNPQLVLSGDSGIVSYYEIDPTGLVFKKPVTLDLHIPQTVTVQGSVTMLNDAQRRALKILYFDGFEWQSANGTFLTRTDDNGVTQEFIRTTINHFTAFTLGLDDREAPPLTGPIISEVTPDKNPFSPNGDDINDFVVLRYFLGRAATVTIRVLDSGGNVVRTLADRVAKPAGFNTDVWDGTYIFSERTVPSGIYIIHVQATAEGARDEQSVGIAVMK